MKQLLSALMEAHRAKDWPTMAIYIQGITAMLLLQEAERHATEPVLPVLPVACAWCMVEAGVPLGNGSHSICQRHAEQVVEQARIRKMARQVA